MTREVFIQKCEKCGEDVYGIFTSSFEDLFTILYECSQCGQVWSEDKPLGTKDKVTKGKRASAAKEKNQDE